MQSLSNLKKSSLTTVAIAGCMVALTGAASANSVTLSINGGAASGSLSTVSGTSNTFTVTVFANLGPTGGGNNQVTVSLNYDESLLTGVACIETPAFTQATGGGFWAPFTTNCGAGNPGDGGLVTPGLVLGLEQGNVAALGTSGTLILGTVTFHIADFGTSSIQADLGFGGGFLGQDFTNRTTGIPLGAVTISNVPEPTTISLVGLGILGLGLSSRRLRRR